MNLRNVLITGCSSGIGFETALYLARQGFRVYAGIRDLRAGERLLAEASRRQVRISVVQLDITDIASVQWAAQRILLECGRIDAVVNNAGIQLRGFFEDISDQEIRRVFDTNVFGTMAVIRSILPSMRSEREGRIVIVTSVGGRMGSPGSSAYCATKFALEGFGESLAQEAKPFGISVSLVEPAIVKTEVWGANRGIARAGLNPESPNYGFFVEVERVADRLVETSPTTPVGVARAVSKALRAKHPRLRYVVGWRASLVIGLRRHLPGEWFERMYFGELTRRMTKAGDTARLS